VCSLGDVPTDPYIPPDPAARPRQQQNLPPGLALPPASGWEAERPGDLGPGQPQGDLLGTPGPNVGFAYTLVEQAKDRFHLGEHEDIHDVGPVIAELAGRRAALFGRAPVMRDITHAAMILGYEGNASAEWITARTLLVQEAGHSYPKRRAIVDSVPEHALRSGPDTVQSDGEAWRALTAGVDRQPTM
jgi:hypothetical protein